MNTIIDDLQAFLLNIFLVLTFFYLYLNFIEGKIRRSTNEFIITLVSGFFIVISMTFTIHLSAGHMVELRQVPFLLGALYGGRRVAIYLFLILIAYRFYLGGSGFYITLGINSLLLVSLWFIIPQFKKTVSITKKVYLAISACFFAISLKFLIISLFFSDLLNVKYVAFTGTFLFVQSIGVITFVALIEKSRKDTVLAKELRKLEKLRTVSDIAASISHEVRNPLTVTKGFLQLLQDPDLTVRERSDYIEIAVEELNKAETTISDYLTFAKPSLENIKVLNLGKELTNAIKVVQPFAAMNNVSIELRQLTDVSIAGEVQKFHQCLINLIKNSIEAMPDGGNLFIVTHKQNGKAVIIVADTGIGMTEEQIERLGTPYYSTKEKGTGLGTMVIFSIVKVMRGEIKVDSEVGKGTRFTVLLPTVERSTSFT